MTTKFFCVLTLAAMTALPLWANKQPSTTAEQAKTTPSIVLTEKQKKLFDNFHTVSDGVYRSAWPEKKCSQKLGEMGFRTVLNLRNDHPTPVSWRDKSVNYIHLPMNAGSLTEQNIIDAVMIIDEAEKPILIHCWQGSDRTGAIAAAWQIVNDRKYPETAIQEMQDKKYGFHRLTYPNIPKLMRSMNWRQLRDDVTEERIKRRIHDAAGRKPGNKVPGQRPRPRTTSDNAKSAK